MARWILLCTIALYSCSPKSIQTRLPQVTAPEIKMARASISRGELQLAIEQYTDYINTHPAPVQTDLTRLELGILQADMGRCVPAITQFERAEESTEQSIRSRATLHLGSCYATLGDPNKALQTLDPVLDQPFDTQEEFLLWESVLVSSEQTADAPLALRTLDRMLASHTASPSPARVHALLQVLIEQKLSSEEAIDLLDKLNPGQRVQIMLARRLLPEALAIEDADLIRRTAQILNAAEASNPQTQLWLSKANEFFEGNPYMIGVLVPLTGRGQEVGRQLLQGMQLAETLESGPQLIVRDTAGKSEQTIRALDQLIDEDRVIAILGPVGTYPAAAAIEQTEQAQMPMLTFVSNEDVIADQKQVFRFLYSPRDELRALVKASREQGRSKYIILYPDQGYGQALRQIFEQEVSISGGVSCPAVSYPPGTKSLIDYVKEVLESECDTVLLADSGAQIALIAPTFAIEGAWSTASGALPEGAEREIHYLLPTPSWSPSLLKVAARYLQGALVVQPYFNASEEPSNMKFRQEYIERYGQPPGIFAAYGYDAYRMLAHTLKQGAMSRVELTDALKNGVGIDSVTSVGTLSTEHVPAHPPRIYEIIGSYLEEFDPRL